MTRRTQEERTETTRTALVESALDLLDEVGWAATTAVAVCERAGLTRGALVHHFGDLPTLLAEALEVHHARLSADVANHSRPTSMVELVEQSWRVVERGRFKVVIEAWLAAANDADLATTVGPVIAGFAEVVDPSRHDVLTDAEAVELFLTLREAILGLALGRATQGGPLPHERTVVDRLVEIARAHDARSTRQDALTGGTP